MVKGLDRKTLRTVEVTWFLQLREDENEGRPCHDYSFFTRGNRGAGTSLW